ncbi:uncharacterized protein LOC121910145 isoform X2 [Thunnus maccoyii]|uniref:uncharacterized protein LOC121910145 isoform X2 n=2 Tax=Thunnus maccoyii TaxID=8240 RepID=UPI001C4B3543|nr:uncharacterized protein LOC121910145 isoform X2 [Thunnus maccoyii]
MLLAEAGCVFMGIILYISGVQGRANSICALKKSSVDLPCSAQHPTSSMKWFTVHRNGSEYVLNELSTDGNRVKYNMSEESNYTLTIKDLRESDAKSYCCSNTTETPELCWHNRTKLHVSDLHVKVIPATEGQTVSLICKTSCPPTENPAAYIWYKNREFLYQDWSPWYQQLVSSEEAVRYSCAIKDYKHLRAPEVSVDSVTSTCFTVTYAKGRMCSKKQTSVNESCSITYPREVGLQRTAEVNHTRLTCNTSCPLADNQTAYRWYNNRLLMSEKTQQFSVLNSSADIFSCAVKDHEDLHSAEVCVEDKNCWSVNYVRRTICALEGSSVNISSNYSYPNNQRPKSKLWYKITAGGEEEVEKVIELAGRVEYHDSVNNQHVLRIKHLKKNDSAEYTFRLEHHGGRKQSDFPGVTLVVTGLRVKLPPASVAEGQRVTLTCMTSCPLTDNTTYIWYLNKQHVNLPHNKSKQLVLDPVRSHHAGNYSCAVTSHKNFNSSEGTLTVESKCTFAAGAVVALLVITPLFVFLWIRRKRRT